MGIGTQTTAVCRCALMAVGLMAPISPALAQDKIPEVSQIAGVWATTVQSDSGPVWQAFVDANKSAVTRNGDIVRGREAYVFLVPKVDGKFTYEEMIREGEFNCVENSVKWDDASEIDVVGHIIHIVPPPSNASASPLSADSSSFATLEFLCGSDNISNQSAYFSLEFARNALLIDRGSESDEDPLPPAPNASLTTDEPPTLGSWRALDEQVSLTQMIDTSSLTWQGRSVRAWVAVIDTLDVDKSAGARAVSEARIEINCDTSLVFISLVRHLNGSGDLLGVVKRDTPGTAADFGLFDKANGHIGIMAACHPQRLGSIDAYKTPLDYRARVLKSRRFQSLGRANGPHPE